jgi:hypothetical protein
LFDATKDGLHINGALFAQGFALLREVAFGSPGAHCHSETDLSLAVAFGLGTFRFERAPAAVLALVQAAFALVAVVGMIAMVAL